MLDEDALEFDDEADEEFELELKAIRENTTYKTYEEKVKAVLPLLNSDPDKMIMMQVIVSLAQEKVIGKQLKESDFKMLEVVLESIISDSDKKRQAIRFFQRLLN